MFHMTFLKSLGLEGGGEEIIGTYSGLWIGVWGVASLLYFGHHKEVSRSPSSISSGGGVFCNHYRALMDSLESGPGLCPIPYTLKQFGSFQTWGSWVWSLSGVSSLLFWAVTRAALFLLVVLDGMSQLCCHSLTPYHYKYTGTLWGTL